MDRKIVLSVISIVLIVTAIAILIPGGRAPDSQPRLPWDITVNDAGSSSVFGIALGKSTLAEARDILQDHGETSLFVSSEGEYHVESYFKSIALSGLRASFILGLDVDAATKEAMFKRGERLKKLESGAKQVTLADADMLGLAHAVINNITYIPKANLEPELIEGRFGQPRYKIGEANEAGTTHWLYPKKGLDISHNTEGKEVFQYVKPSEFDQILKPLQKAAAEQ